MHTSSLTPRGGRASASGSPYGTASPRLWDAHSGGPQGEWRAGSPSGASGAASPSSARICIKRGSSAAGSPRSFYSEDPASPLTRGKQASGLGFLILVLIAANTMNGPGLLALSKAMHSAGWVPTVLCLVFAALLTGTTVSLFTDVLEKSGVCVEFGDLSEQRLGPRGQTLTLSLLGISLVMLACAQIVVTSQALDAVYVGIFGWSAAVTVYPTVGVVSTTDTSLMPFQQGTYGISLGFVTDAAVCVALGRLDLKDNIVPQYVSASLITIGISALAVHFISSASGSVPAFGGSYESLLGVAVFNFAYVIAVPSLFVDARPGVNFRGAMWVSVGVMCVLCIGVAFLGALAANPDPPADNILQAVYASEEAPFYARLGVQCFCVGITLPIPVYHILCKRNLAAILPQRLSDLLSVALPWLLACVCYMQPWFGALVNWSSLLCLGFINYTVPLVITLCDAPGSAGREAAAHVCLVMSTIAIVGALMLNVRGLLV